MFDDLRYKGQKIFEQYNGKGCIGTPRTIGELQKTLELTVNAPRRYQQIESREGRILLEEIQSLERVLAQVLYQPHKDNDRLDNATMERAEELLVRLDLLGHMTVAFALRKMGLRTRKDIADLLPRSASNDAERQNADELAADMNLSEV